MPNTAPGTTHVTGGVPDGAVPVPAARARVAARRLAGTAGFLLLLVALFYAYLRLSQTYPENSDEANILLMADDMLHGNLFLSGWHVSDVPFITTELPEMAMLVNLFGLRLETAHIAAALTYTLVVAVAMLLARGRSRGKKALVRMAVALGIMLAPQPGVGIFVADFSVGHIGTALPVMLTWLVIDWAVKPGASARSRWWLPVAVAVMLAWAETTDPLVLVIAILPMALVCLARVITGFREAGGAGPERLRAVARARWTELSLAAAAGIGYLIALVAGLLLRQSGGYVQQPVPYNLDSPGKWFMQARIVVHGLLEIFGAYFVPGQQEAQAGVPPPGMLDQLLAYAHLAGVILAVWGAFAIARRFFRADADFVSQLLLTGIVANIVAYIPSALADHSALNTREIAPVLPFAAVLAARMLGERLLRAPLAGPRLRIGAGRHVGALTATLAALMAVYAAGLGRQASTPPAAEPYASLVSYLKTHHLTYGVGGYWQSSVITVESGGAVQIRAVSPACLQPYQWESKTEWYDPSRHRADFLLLDNVPGFFSQFSPSPAALILLNQWLGTAKHEDAGSHKMVKGFPLYQYEARVYDGNLLAELPRLNATLPNPPASLVRQLRAAGNTVTRGPNTCG